MKHYSLRAASPKYQLDMEIAKKSNFFKLARNEALRALVKKNFVLSSINQKLFFCAIVSFRCPKSAKIDRN